MHILVKREAGWDRPKATPFVREDAFQSLVQDVFPRVLASQFDRPSIVAREVSTPEGGRVDVVSIDQDGIITLCECKLERNAGSRREVLGQILEYAGSFAGMPFDEFAARVSDRLGANMLSTMRDVAAEDFDADAWADRVRDHLRTGKFRLIVAVDALTQTLRQTVMYLNERCDFPVVAAELRLVSEAGMEFLVPQLFGDEAAERKLVRRTRAAPIIRNPDVLIVPATRALAEYRKLGAYICQPQRSFQPVEYLGFYWQRRIEPEFPRILGFCRDVLFTVDEAERLMAQPEPLAVRVGEVVKRALEDQAGERQVGERYQVVPLDPHSGFTLEAPVAHEGSSAWTQNQRYATAAALKTQPATTEDLARAEA